MVSGAASALGVHPLGCQCRDCRIKRLESDNKQLREENERLKLHLGGYTQEADYAAGKEG